MTALALSTWPSAREDAGEAEWVKMQKRSFSDGVHAWADDNNKFRPFGDSTGMQMKVDTGSCGIYGIYGESLILRTMGVAAAHSTLDRLDLAVLRLEFSSPFTIYLDIKTGTAASTPALPSLTVDTSMVEVPVAKIIVGHGVTTIRAQDVIDQRTWYEPHASVPIGTVLDTLCDSPPAGFLLFHGQTVNSADYPALAKALKITASTITLPDARDKFIRGANGNLGATGGAVNDEITITDPQVPPHHHGPDGSGGATGFVFAAPGAQNNSLGGSTPGGGGQPVGVTFTGIYDQDTGTPDPADPVTITPRYLALNKMIRAY